MSKLRYASLIFLVLILQHTYNQSSGNQHHPQMSKLRLEGKVALITGAASGIGEEAVKLFAENGEFVVAADIEDEAGQQVVTSVGTDRASYHHCDVRDEKQVGETVNYALQKYGKIDILFSNAGIIGPLTGILDLDIEGFDNTMATNFVLTEVCFTAVLQ